MRIALLAPLEFPLREPYAGGLERHTVQLARGLAARGHEITLFARAGSDGLERVRFVPADSYHAVLRTVDRGAFDLLHNNCLNWLPTLLSWRYRIPTITTLHTPPYRKPGIGGLVARYLGRTRFIAISEVIARQWKPIVGQLPVIHNGIDPERFPFSSTGEAGTAVWVGRISPEKAPHHAIRSARMAGYRLTLIGPIYDEGYHRQHILPMLGNDVRYLGPLSRKEMLPHLSSAAVALFTSTWEEPFGLVLLEYLSCGTPVAAYASGAATEILTERVSALAATGDVRQLSACLAQASTCVRAHCRAHVEQHFPLSKMITAYEAHYRTFTASP